MWQRYIQPRTVNEAVELLATHGQDARIINGGTDLLIEIERRIRAPGLLIDVSRLPDLDYIREEGEHVTLGAGVTHNQAVGSELLRRLAYPLVRACWEVGAPQIRNRATIAGNLITASPANDTITPLWAMGAQVKLKSTDGERVVPLDAFYRGVRKTALEPNEMLVEIQFRKMPGTERGTFIKLGLRRAQAISVVNTAVILRMRDGKVENARITLGSVAPTIVSASEAELFLADRELKDEFVDRAAELAMGAAKPIDDVRGTAEYRREMVRVLVARALRQIRDGRLDLPDKPVMLWGTTGGRFRPHDHATETHSKDDVIETTVNGKKLSARGSGKSLLRFLREDLHLVGTKEGCAEGECGACTVYLDGMAVMSCLVPAARAHHAKVVTVEGLASNGKMHPIQKRFVEHGAVQCGYCTPGFVMSGAKLLEENPTPTTWDVQQAVTGNLCRCTGYYKIIEAIKRANEGAQVGLNDPRTILSTH